jgi:hypothetical protein
MKDVARLDLTVPAPVRDWLYACLITDNNSASHPAPPVIPITGRFQQANVFIDPPGCAESSSEVKEIHRERPMAASPADIAKELFL